MCTTFMRISFILNVIYVYLVFIKSPFYCREAAVLMKWSPGETGMCQAMQGLYLRRTSTALAISAASGASKVIVSFVAGWTTVRRKACRA